MTRKRQGLWAITVRFLKRQVTFSLIQSVATGHGVHPASYSARTGNIFQRIKAAGLGSLTLTPYSSYMYYKFYPVTGHENPEGEQMYNSTLPSTSALDEVGSQRHDPAALPRERPSTQCIGGWVGPRAGLDGCGKSRSHRDSIPGPSSLYRVAIPTALSRSIVVLMYVLKLQDVRPLYVHILRDVLSEAQGIVGYRPYIRNPYYKFKNLHI
jgi:hypothetical protein